MRKQVLFISLLFCGFLASAQPGPPPSPPGEPGERFERIRKARQAFIVEYLQLTDQEERAFFPVFWKHEDRIHALKKAIFESRPGRRMGRRNPGVQAPLSEEEAHKQLLEGRENRRRLLELNLEAEAVYLEILPAAKLLQLAEAEKMFRRKLWERAKRARQRN